MESNETVCRLAREMAGALVSAQKPLDLLGRWLERAAAAAGAEFLGLVLVHRRTRSGYLVAASTDPLLSPAVLDASLVDPAGLVTVPWRGGPDAERSLLAVLREHVDVPADSPIVLVGQPMVKDMVSWLVGVGHREDQTVSRQDLDVLLGVLSLALRGTSLTARLAEQTARVRTPSSVETVSYEVMARYRDLFNVSSDGVLIVDQKGRIQYANHVAESITGFSSNWLTGQRVDVLVGSEDAQLLEEAVGDVLAGRVISSLDLAMKTTSGDVRYVNASVNLLPGAKRLAVVTFQDMTDTRVVEEELYWTTEFLERLIQSAVDAILYCEPDGTVQLFNTGAENLFGYASEDVVGQLRVQDLFQEGEAERLLEMLRSPKNGGVGRLQPVDSVVVARDGTKKDVQLTGALVLDGDMELGMLFIISDQTDTVRLREQYLRVRERLMEREKEALVAQLAGATAHELNQPLTSIMGYAEMLKRRLPDDPHARKAADVIIAEAERMADIVRKIGRITRFETKQYVGSAQILDLDKSAEEE